MSFKHTSRNWKRWYHKWLSSEDKLGECNTEELASPTWQNWSSEFWTKGLWLTH